MIHAQIVTRWLHTVDAAGTPHNDPAIESDVPFGDGEGWSDVTGQPAENITPTPNLLVVECVVSDATFAAILAHPDYGPGAVLQSDKPKDVVADKADHDALRALLAAKGCKAKDVDAAAGKAANGRTRKQIADDLIAWLRALPKG